MRVLATLAALAVFAAQPTMLLAAAAAAASQAEQLEDARRNAAEAAELADVAREKAEAAQGRANDSHLALDAARGKAIDLDVRIAQLGAEVEDVQEERVRLRDSLTELAVFRYVNSGNAAESVWLAGDDINRQVRVQAMVRFVTLGRTDTLDQFRVVDDRLEEAGAELEELKSEQQSAIAESRRLVADLTAELQTMQQQLAIAEREEKRFDDEVGRLQEEERRRLEEERRAREEAERARRQAALASANSGPVLITDQFGFTCPVSGPASFINDWGFSRPGGRRHRGNDIFTPRGSPVVAPVPGVAYPSSNRLGGQVVFLDGDDGHRYYLAHLDSYGQSGRVSKGATLGSVGSTGNARGTAPHLHFEIHPGHGPAVNPYATLVGACA